MSLACYDIVVTLSEFNTTDTFEVALRPQGSQTDFDQAQKKTATSSTVIFAQVLGSYWEVAVRRSCANGGFSALSWQPPVSVVCTAPTNLVVTPNSATQVTVNFTAGSAPSYEYRLGLTGAWTAIADGGTISSLSAGTAYTLHLRGRCSDGSYTDLVSRDFVTTTTSPSFTNQVLTVDCENGYYQAHVMRISLSGGVAAVGQLYRIVYTIGTDTMTLLQYTVQSGDTYADIMAVIEATVNPFKVVVEADQAYCDFFSRDIRPEYPSNPRCTDVVTSSAYTTSIV